MAPGAPLMNETPTVEDSRTPTQTFTDMDILRYPYLSHLIILCKTNDTHTNTHLHAPSSIFPSYIIVYHIAQNVGINVGAKYNPYFFIMIALCEHVGVFEFVFVHLWVYNDFPGEYF